MNRRSLLPVVVAFIAIAHCFSTPATAQDRPEWSVIVKAGKYDRQDVPVSATFRLPKSAGDVTSVTLTGPDGVKVPAQITALGLLESENGKAGELQREVHFIVPEIKAGETATFSVGPPSASGGYAWTNTPAKQSELTYNGRPVLRYMYETLDESSAERRQQTYKVFHHVFDPAGKRLVTKGPGGLFPHHRGLFYGFNRISYGDGKTADIWHCKKGTHQSHEGFAASESGPVVGRQLLAIDWHGEDKKVFAKELREMTVYRVPGGQMIEFASVLKSEVGPIHLDGDPQHAGFQFRASQEVPDKTAKQTYYVRPDGKGEPGKFRNWPKDAAHVNLPWNALSFVLGDQRLTACYLDHPGNPKESRYSERDYGRFGSYFAYDVKANEPLKINYRVWLQNGEMDVAGVNRLSHDFVDPPSVEVVRK